MLSCIQIDEKTVQRTLSILSIILSRQSKYQYYKYKEQSFIILIININLNINLYQENINHNHQNNHQNNHQTNHPVNHHVNQTYHVTTVGKTIRNNQLANNVHLVHKKYPNHLQKNLR